MENTGVFLCENRRGAGWHVEGEGGLVAYPGEGKRGGKGVGKERGREHEMKIKF